MKTLLLECKIKHPVSRQWIDIKKRFYCEDNIREWEEKTMKEGYAIKHLSSGLSDKNKYIVVPRTKKLEEWQMKESVKEEIKDQYGYDMLFIEQKTTYLQVAKCTKADLEHGRRVSIYIPFFRYNCLDKEFNSMEEALECAITWEAENTLGDGFLKQYDIYQYPPISKWREKMEKWCCNGKMIF